MAAAHSLWEWDETLFCLALRDFNVAAHHPHPPGFPLYVALGKLLRFVVADDFRALRAINLLSAMLVFPATYMLAREMKQEVLPSISAALLTSFAPNVWFYGGTAFSDEPTLTLLLFGGALLLRGRTSRGAFFAGCVVMAAACVMRPQNVLVGAYPFLAGAWPRWKERKLDPILGAALMFVIIAAFFGAAAYITGFDAYRSAVRMHGQYVMSVDAYKNPSRPAWFRNWREFIGDPYAAGKISSIIGTFAALGALRFRRPVREALAMFAPFVVFSLFMLNVEAAGRYAMTAIPLLMMCGAEGVRVVGDAIGRAGAWARGLAGNATSRPRALVPASPIIQIIAIALIITRLIRWTLPALAEVRRHDAPTVEASRWIHRHLDRRKTTLYIHGSMGPWAEYLLHDYKQVPVEDNFSGVSLADVSNAWLVTEGVTGVADGVNFVRPRGHLFNISRKRYFEVSVRPLTSDVGFRDGWYDEESDGVHVWRWMGQRSTTLLAPLRGHGELALKFQVPLDAEPRKPVATITINGKVIDRFACDAVTEKCWVVPSSSGAANVLVIELDEFVNPFAQNLGGDARDLGLQLHAYSWRAVEGP